MKRPRPDGSCARPAPAVPWALALLALAGCGRPADDEPVREAARSPAVVREITYELIHTQAGDLPALLGERDGCRYSAVGGAVTLNPDNRFDASLVRVRHCPQTMASDTFMDTGTGLYALEGDSVYFRYEGGIPAGTGSLAGDSLIVRGPGQVMTYRRTEF